MTVQITGTKSAPRRYVPWFGLLGKMRHLIMLIHRKDFALYRLLQNYIIYIIRPIILSSRRREEIGKAVKCCRLDG